jgi:signal transduction histidine kinase
MASMTYNAGMKTTASRSDAVRMIRLAAFLLLGYVIVLAFINQIFQSPQLPQRQVPEPATVNQTLQLPQRQMAEIPAANQTPARQFSEPATNQTLPQQTLPQPLQQHNDYLYYILYGSTALVCLILAYWTWLQRKLRQAFIPVVITILAISPVIVSQLSGTASPLGPRFGSPEANVLVMFPFLFVALLLVAWQYKWQHILFIILGITALNMGTRWSNAGPGTQLFQGVLAVFLIQTVIFLVVGFSISYLMSRLRAQQQSLEEANIRLTQYASTLEHLATSRERNRLALELHDTLAHTLSGLSVQLETIKAYWDVDKPTARAILEKSLLLTHSGLEETRRALKSLRASPLEDMGLTLALRKMAEDSASRAGLVLEMPEIIMVPPLSPNIEQCVYRIAQEAIANVVKHASAKTLTVKLEFMDGGATLLVSDDGIGFELDKIDKTGHFGISGMQERAQMVGGELEIISKKGLGTTIKLTINQVTGL